VAGVRTGVRAVREDLVLLQADVEADAGETETVVGIRGRDPRDVGPMTICVLSRRDPAGHDAVYNFLAVHDLSAGEIRVIVIEARVEDCNGDARDDGIGRR